MSFSSLGDTLNSRFNQKGPLKKQLDDSQVVEESKVVLLEMFGEELVKTAIPLFLKNRTLTISCSSSAMAQEIRLNQTQIVEKLNEKLGRNEVDRIRYLT
ncbi:MAG: hypothetical protein COX80_03855 [Candidatus Magasanikbacteria bacterium CG_4_10_14_0_2_um_filter_33_14]|uniref:DUF721 domain-containing protein n=1 Tax=Candidatus Magasanikbacteria bacterium CG_4_10_14_0_2_um_filter_33_14 TaxID=1974636 RepID=A0A2M7VA00_9BACT|nr:MAG: hypothetical protein COX80_03855 [Candidatus Magasanikbacteria bacterium CG_4_10_14_0_2_um_filter_33_14]